MKFQFLGRLALAGAIALSTGFASSKSVSTVPKTDAELTKSVLHEIRMYPYYSVWDDISFRVANGQVELDGAVTQPIKKSDIEHIVQRVPGVASVADNIKVLPLSPNDNLLRRQVAAAIYRDPAFTLYAMEAVPPVHIIVENGHVTLTGVVSTDFEKNIAGMRAASAGLSFGPIVNNLQVEHPSKKS